MYSQYSQAKLLQLQLTRQLDQSTSSQELVWFLVSSILSFTLGLGVISITLLGIGSGRVAAQIPQTSQGESTRSEVKMLFVNPRIGNNSPSHGSQREPLRTITYALQVATPNTMIILSPGNYTADTGEIFPLILKPDVVIQGDSLTKGQGITIRGGGTFLSRSFGGQNVTIVGADKAELSGVTVTNPQPRGYGLWVESSNPVITNNTFTGNTQDGISITGNSSPTIRLNYFHRNGANGITIGGNSQAQVRENVFDQTGFGINITDNAAPILGSNQIQNNRYGIIVQGNARPILRQNLIQGSREDGLVVLTQSIPNLGTITEPGGNQFRNNRGYDINGSASNQRIPAAGNNLLPNRITGNIDFQAQTAPIAQNPQQPTVTNRPAQKITANEEIIFSPPSQPNQADQSQMNSLQIDPNIVEFVAPQSPHPDQAPPFGESPLLPIPNPNTPPTQSIASTGEPQGLRYRVVVNIKNDQERDIVLNLVPEAFPTVRQGRRFMQVGVFSDRNNADEILNLLQSFGLRTIIEPLR